MTECKRDNKVLIVFIVFIFSMFTVLFEGRSDVKVETSRLSEGLWVEREEQEAVCRENNI